MAGMWLVGEDMPQETNRITLDPKAKDKFGMPVASVHFDDHPNDVAMRNHAYKQGAAVYEAVGATVTYPTPPYPSTHNLGTNRMSEKPRDGVVNKFGQAHDVKNLFISDGSQFTSGAACNPTLTIVSLAIRQADHIAGAMQRKEILVPANGSGSVRDGPSRFSLSDRTKLFGRVEDGGGDRREIPGRQRRSWRDRSGRSSATARQNS